MRLLLSMAALWLAGCATKTNPACTEMGCQTGARVAFRTAHWDPGSYRVQIAADGKKTECNVTIPLPTDTDKPACDNDHALLELNGALLPVHAQSLGGVQVLRRADEISVQITRDGHELASRTFTPRWREVQPNGPGCPPTCTQGDESELAF